MLVVANRTASNGLRQRRCRVDTTYATSSSIAIRPNTLRTWRTSRAVTRRPVIHSTAFHTRLTVTIRQNATRTPGVSARLTSVDDSEKATTRPTTASTPSVLALSFSAGARVATLTAAL